MIKNKFFSIKKKKESRSDGFTELSLKEDLSLLNKKRDSRYNHFILVTLITIGREKLTLIQMKKIVRLTFKFN